MSLLVVGLSHRTAPVPLLERLAVPPQDAPDVLAGLLAGEHVREALLLSTCNRVEVYADVSRFHGGVADLTAVLEKRSGVRLDEVPDQVYVHYEDRAVQHLFEVAAGLDSMVVGEAQILGQLRLALRAAQAERSAARALNEVAQAALRVGKRVHAETGIDRAGASLVSVGVELAAPRLDGLEGRSAVLVGAGAMSGLAAATLRRAGVGSLDVVNRSAAGAERLAAAYGGAAHPMSALGEVVRSADLLVSCTGSTSTVVGVADVGRRDRPLAVLDLALPRDVDPAVGALPGVTLLDLATLRDVLAGREQPDDVHAAHAVVAEEVAAFLRAQRGSRVAPTVTALRAKADELVEAELGRLGARLPDLDAREREEVTATVRRVVDKLLHAPTVRVKQLAAAPGGQAYAEALGELFGLDPQAVEAVTRADVGLDEGDAP